MNPKKHLIFIVFLSILMTAVILPSLFAEDEETTDYEVVPCENPDYFGWAWISDSDPAGTNVRSGPGTGYSVLTKLPTDCAVIVKITGSVGEWIQIGEFNVYDDMLGFTPIDGWIHSSLLVVRVLSPEYPWENAPLYAEPSFDAPVLTTIPADTYVMIAGCRGGWTKVRYEEFEGWLPPQCHHLLEDWGWGGDSGYEKWY